MSTWSKFLPDYEIVVLDRKNISQWLDRPFNPILESDFSLPQQADAIRCAVLFRHGGVWLDTDTIITGPHARKLFESEAEITLIWRHIGFIAARKGSSILERWERGIRRRLAIYALCKKSAAARFIMKLAKGKYRQMTAWNCLGNSILDRILARSNGGFNELDRNKIGALPEVAAGIPYEKYWFENDFDVPENAGLIYLHNSWTPERFKKMPQEEFLKQKCTLSRLLSKLL